MEYYQNPFADFGKFFRSREVLPVLILINAGVWLLISALRVIVYLMKIPEESVLDNIVGYLAVPANTTLLAQRPWTLVTYMFLHIEIWHILFNMLWLFWFGKIFREYLNARQLLMTYLLGGLSGGILYVISYNIFPAFREIAPQSVALGASASVMAIVTAISFYIPNYTIYMLFLGKIKIFYIAIALFILDFFMIRSGNAGGHIAHIGGAVYGFAFVFFLRKGKDFSKILGRGGSFRSIFRTMRTGYSKTSGGSAGRPLTDEEFNLQKKIQQEKMDRILDKISRSGYESLTREEKEFLFNSGNQK
jgi:membrane associated rhomboid family serine protease